MKNITIVGGGSAGWMTAATLIKCFPSKKITLIESPNIPTIGVGESTLSIPILRPEDNILFADICNLGIGIIGIGYQTDSGSRIKVGFQDSSMEKLRYWD